MAAAVQRTSSRNVAPRVARAIRRAIGLDSPVAVTGTESKGEIRLLVAIGKKNHRLVAHWVGFGWGPNSVRQALQRYGEPWPRQHVLVARHFSPGALDLMRDVDANWVDEAGHTRIVTTSGLFVARDTASSRARDQTQLTWTESQSDVAEAILAEREVPAVRDLAEMTGWSLQPVSSALRVFDQRGWTRKVGSERGRGSKRELVNDDALLDAWGEHASRAHSERLLVHASMRDPLIYLRTELVPALAGLGDYAVSGWAGAQLVAPFLTTVPTLQIYVAAAAYDAALPHLVERSAMRIVSSGARIDFIRAHPAALLRRRQPQGSSVFVAHPARLYADLLALGDRGRDAAEHVRVELLHSRKP